MYSINTRKPLSMKSCLFMMVMYFVIIYIFSIDLWYHILGKSNVFRVIFFCLILISISLYMLSQQFFVFTITSYSFLLYICYCFFYCIEGGHGVIYESIYTYCFLPFSYVGFIYLLTQCGAKKTIAWVIVISLIISILSIYEYYTKRSIILGDYLGLYFRSSVFADSCLSLACQLGVGVVLCITQYAISKKIVFLIGAGVCVFGLLTTGSRGPFVGCVISILVFAFYGFKAKNRNTRILLIALLCFGVLTLVMVFASGIIVFDKNSFLWRIQSIFDWKTDTGNLERLRRWNIYIKLFLDRPLLGHGPGYCLNSPFGVAESGVLQRLVELGLVGSFLYYSFILSLFFKSFYDLKRFNKKERTYMCGLLSSCLCILVEDCVLQIYESTIVMTLLYIILASVFVLRCDKRGLEVK